MYKSGFAYKASINQNAYGWSTSGNACFYIDENDFCRSNSLKQFRNEHSYGISSSASGNAYIYKTINVTQNTDYVINVMVKSTFTVRNTSPVSSLPAYMEVSASGVSERSIELVGVADEWTEMSVGFNSGSNTSVTVKIGVDFPTNISGLESVLFSDIRLDKITPTKVLFLAYSSATISNLSYSSSYSGTATNLNNKLNIMATQFKNIIKKVSNGKVILQLATKISSLPLTNMEIDTTQKLVHVRFNHVLANNPEINFSDYDCVICNVPIPYILGNGYSTYFGVFRAIYNLTGSINKNYESLDEKIGFIHLSKDFLENFSLTGTNNLDGEIHEFVHYLEWCASRLDKRIGEFYPYNDDYNADGDAFEITRDSETYHNYKAIYETKFKNNSSTYNWLIPTSLFTSQEISAGYAWKYRWYYDKLNGCALDYCRDRGFWGMRSNWVEIGCTEMTYHMKKCLGIKQGVYHVINNQSGKYVSSTVNASGYPTQSDKTYLADQYWDFVPAGNGTYEIVSLANSSKRLTATNSSSVILSPASGESNQKWRVVRATDTTFTIVSVAHNTYLSRASTTANYIALTSTLSTTGYWRFANVNAVVNGIDKLINVNSSKLASVTTSGSYTITQQTYAYDLNQMWQAKLCADGYFQLIPLHSQTVCLTATSSGEQVAVQTNTEANTQKWLIVADSVSGNYRIHSKAYPNKMLTSASSSTSVGTGIKLNSDSTSALAKWNIESLHGNGSFVCRLENGLNSAMYMKEDNESTGYDVVQHARISSTGNNYKYLANFIWEFQLQSDGFYKIIPLSSIKKCLTAANTSSSPAVLSLHCDKGDDSQKWVVIQLSDGKYRISPKNNITKAVKATATSSNAYTQLETFTTSGLAKWNVNLFNVTGFAGNKYKMATQNASSRYFDARDDNSASAKSDTVNRDDIVTIYSSAQNNSQTWLFRMVDGFYEILPIFNYNYRMTAILTSLTAPTLRKKYADDSEEQKWIVEEVASNIYRIAPRENPSMAITLATYEEPNEDGNYLHLGTGFKDTDKERITFTYVP